MRQGLRVCHVIPTLQHGGAEDLLVELAQVAGSAGVDMSVVSLRRTEVTSVLGRLRALDVPVRTLEVGRFWDPRSLWRGVGAIRGLRPDLVHTHMKHADVVGAAAHRRIGIPMVSTLHVIEDGVGPVGATKRWMASRARVWSASRTIAVSEAQRRWYLRAVPSDPARVVTVRNGVRRRTL
ncbi:MAG TPA: glycosyltransferase, partial [Acidimicrobiales bacterium]|nr:glycosyltransferase [Acidimicrobiales bacterium]